MQNNQNVVNNGPKFQIGNLQDKDLGENTPFKGKQFTVTTPVAQKSTAFTNDLQLAEFRLTSGEFVQLYLRESAEGEGQQAVVKSEYTFKILSAHKDEVKGQSDQNKNQIEQLQQTVAQLQQQLKQGVQDQNVNNNENQPQPNQNVDNNEDNVQPQPNQKAIKNPPADDRSMLRKVVTFIPLAFWNSSKTTKFVLMLICAAIATEITRKVAKNYDEGKLAGLDTTLNFGQAQYLDALYETIYHMMTAADTKFGYNYFAPNNSTKG